MHQTKKGKQSYFVRKAHVGGQQDEADSQRNGDGGQWSWAVLPTLLHSEETKVWGEQDYRGQGEAIRRGGAACVEPDHQTRALLRKYGVDEREHAKNRTNLRVCSKAKHVFQILKLKFGFTKVGYGGLGKNANRQFATCAVVDLFTARWKLLRQELA